MKECIERESVLALAEKIKQNFNPIHYPVIDAFVYYINDRLPAADVAPVVHGTWSLESDEEMPNFMFKLVICSVCGEKANHTYNYCPNCGAKNGRSEVR